MLCLLYVRCDSKNIHGQTYINTVTILLSKIYTSVQYDCIYEEIHQEHLVLDNIFHIFCVGPVRCVEIIRGDSEALATC